MWDLVTELVGSIVESPFVACSFVVICVIAVVAWRAAQKAEHEERSYYVDPAVPRVVPQAPHDAPSIDLQRGARVSDSRAGTYSESCYETTGLTRSPQDAA